MIKGHVNEKNFVGLATDGDYITCGSENNGLYIYYKVLFRSASCPSHTNVYIRPMKDMLFLSFKTIKKIKRCLRSFGTQI